MSLFLESYILKSAPFLNNFLFLHIFEIFFFIHMYLYIDIYFKTVVEPLCFVSLLRTGIVFSTSLSAKVLLNMTFKNKREEHHKLKRGKITGMN